MIELQAESQNDIIVVSASKNLTYHDYKQILIPALNDCIHRYGQVRLVIHFEKSFRRWEVAAMCCDVKFAAKQRHCVKAIALVGGPIWLKPLAQAATHVAPADIKQFKSTDLNHAISWAQQTQSPSAKNGLRYPAQP